jgi:hypothetical protein
MPSDIQSSANHKLVEMLSNGKIHCSSTSLDEIELIKHGFDINSVEKFSCELRGICNRLLRRLVQRLELLLELLLELANVIKRALVFKSTLSENTMDVCKYYCWQKVN